MKPNVVPGVVATKEIHLRDHFRTVWNRRWTALATFLLVVGAVLTYSLLATRIYEATATVEVQPQARRVAPGQDVSGIGAAGYGWFAEEKYQNTQVEILKSRAVAERAFEILGLKSDPRFVIAKDPVGVFRGMIRVLPRRETGLIEVSMRSRQPEEAARWVNVVAEVYVSRNLEKAKENAAQALESITSQLDPLKKRLEGVEEKRFEVLKETAIYNPEGQQEIVRQRLSKLNEGLNVQQMEAGRLRTVLDKIHETQGRQGDPMAIPELAKDEVLQRLAGEKSILEREFEAVKVTYRPGAPRYQEAESKLTSINQRVWDQVGVNLNRLQNQFDLAVNNVRSLRQDVAQAEDQAFQVGLASSRYDVAKTDAATTKQMYDVIAKTLNEVSVSSQLVANNISLLDRAIPPLYPVAPKKRLNMVLGGLVGMLLGIGVAFFLDYLDNSFQRPEDIEHHLQLNTLAVVPRFDAHGSTALTGAIKEAYQTLRTALIFLSKNRERKVVLLTSTGPQEGKSSTSAHLARTLASAGERVLLVDCDLRRPTQHVHFGLPRDGGLTDYLAAAKPFMNWRANLKPGGPETLMVLTCGPIPPNPPELLGSEGFKAFLDEVRGAFDWIILDSPPAASLSDATLLSQLADLVLLVVRHNHTDRDVVARTVQQLRRVGANLVGVVLNNVDLAGAYSKDYYYAGYYSATDAPETRRKKPVAVK